MNDKELNITVQIKREELRIKRNRNIKKAIIGLIIIFIIFFIFNKAYDLYKERIYRDKRTIMTHNEIILSEFDANLQYTNGIIIKLIFAQEIDKDYVRGRLSAMRQSFSNLSYIKFDNEKYKIDKLRLGDFFVDSANSIDTLLKKDSISQDEKEFLSGIYKVNEAVMNTYSENIIRGYNNDNIEEARYSLYYEGEMLYHLSNTIFVSSDGVNAYIERQQQHESKDYFAETANQLKRSISDEKALALANKLYSSLFDNRDSKLEETGYTSRNYNATTGVGENFEDDSGTYITSIKYSTEDFDENEYIEVFATCGDKNIVYKNESNLTKNEVSEAEIDKIAHEIIKRLNCKLLVLENKSETLMPVLNSTKDANALNYSYFIKDENYYDETTRVYIHIYKDGTIRDVYIGHPSLLDGTYEKITAKISQREAVKALDMENQNSVKSVVLVKSREPYYKIVFNRYGIDFTAHVNAESGELINISGS